MTTLRSVWEIADDLQRFEGGGGTISAIVGALMPTTGYIVAIPVHGRVIPAHDDDSNRLFQTVDWVRRVRPVLARPNRYAGIWRHGRNSDTHLDVVEVFAEKLPALRAGRERGELAIYDIAKGEDISLQVVPNDRSGIDYWEAPPTYLEPSDYPEQREPSYWSPAGEPWVIDG